MRVSSYVAQKISIEYNKDGHGYVDIQKTLQLQFLSSNYKSDNKKYSKTLKKCLFIV